jgi:hypothetical protein
MATTTTVNKIGATIWYRLFQNRIASRDAAKPQSTNPIAEFTNLSR